MLSLVQLAGYALYCAMWPLILGYRYDRDYVFAPWPLIAFGLLVLVTSLFMPRRADDPRGAFLYLASAFYFLPFMAMGAMEARPLSEGVMFTLSMGGIALISRIPISIRPRPLFTLGHLVALASALGLGLVLTFIYFVGLSVFNLDISRVYEFRGESYESIPLLARYVQMLYLYFLAPVSCLIAFYRRWWIPAGVSLVLFVLVMGFSNVKFPFALLLFLFMFYFGRRNGAVFVSMMLLGLTALLTLQQAVFLGQEAPLYDLLVRRGGITRAINTFAHFDVFTQLPFMWWRDSRLTFGLFENTYGVTIPYIVGEYLGFESLAANAGWVASGYAQGGLWGVGIYTLIVGLVLAAAQSLRSTAPVLAIGFGVLAGAMFSEADVTTGLLTGGVLPALLLAWFTSEVRGPAGEAARMAKTPRRLMPWERPA
ncbi:hypothetical protein [Brevundimonas sp.]|uniref:hypothetical protein n=1 Tax=Brevundimonas sp. TaxID=1871086 RepID=UPI002FCC1541